MAIDLDVLSECENPILLSKKDWDFMIEVLDAPPEINLNFVRAIEDFEKMFY